jgi:hypothetical protein
LIVNVDFLSADYAPEKWSSNFTGQADYTDYPDEIKEKIFHGGRPQSNGLRPREISSAFHRIKISRGRHRLQ